MVKPYGAGSRVALREVLLDFRTSRVRRQSAWPGNFRTIACDPVVSFSMAGVLPRNFSSTKISAPSGSEEIETVPTVSSEADNGALGLEFPVEFTFSLELARRVSEVE